MKRYDQLCPVALALDEVGDRWSLVIVRDLAYGPLRFSDLLVANPGIGSNLLTQRLRALTEREIVTRRTLPPPAGSAVYELTGKGRDLLPVLIELARWGVAHVMAEYDAETLKEAIECRRPMVLARGLSGDGEFEVSVGDATVGFVVSGGDYRVTLDVPERPVARVRATLPATIGIILGVVDVAEALTAGDLVIDGDVAAAAEVIRAFQLPLPAPAITR